MMPLALARLLRRLRPVLLLLFLLSPAASRAEPSADLDRAKASFKAGAAAYGAGDYQAAIQALEAAYRITPLPQIAFSLAQAHRRQYFVSRQGIHLRAAVELFRRYIQQVARGGRRADALDALSQLEPLLLAETSRAGDGASPEQRPTRLMITCEAPGARVSLDGAPPAPSPLIRQVQPGKHRVAVTAPGFYSAGREVLAVAGELVLLELELRERPGSVELRLPSNAELYVNGVAREHARGRLTLELAPGRHRVAVAGKGRKLWARTLLVQRGERQTVRVTLERTAQRTAALGFFIAGGAALGSSLTLSAFAIQGENRAEQFLGRQKRGNVSAGDLDDYEEAVSQRRRFRAATAATLAASVGLLTTAVLLHELDYPDPQRGSQLERAARGLSVRSARRALQLDVAPLVAPGSGGALFIGRF